MPPRASASSTPPAKEANLLFLCLGNICRSPAAEAVFAKAVADRGLAARVGVDSCGTGGGSRDWYRKGGYSYHEGDPADSRMAAAAARRAITLTSRSRPLTPGDLTSFDRVLVMDGANERAVAAAVDHWRGTGLLPAGGPTARVERLTAYLRDPRLAAAGRDGVPDPYYGGEKGFELVLDLLEDACGALLDDVVSSELGGT